MLSVFQLLEDKAIVPIVQRIIRLIHLKLILQFLHLQVVLSFLPLPLS